MKLSVKSDYAARAVLSLARSYGRTEARRVEEIARENGVPPNYLVQILIELKSGQIVKSLRGKSGGYQLARPPEETSLADVISAIEGPEPDMGDPLMRRSAGVHALRSAWAEVDAAQHEILSAISLADLVERARGRAENMYYI